MKYVACQVSIIAMEKNRVRKRKYQYGHALQFFAGKSGKPD